jgi:hypothetical protein
MNHLTDAQLNEYLDNAVDVHAQAFIQAHLAECADCRDRLASLQTVFQALAALPEETPGRDLTPSVLRALPRSFSDFVWRLAFAVQAGLSLGFLLLISPILTCRFAGIMQAMAGRISRAEVKLPTPINPHFSLPVIQLPHPLIIPTFPITITSSNMPIWLILGIAAVLLFAVGNFSLVFHSSSEFSNNNR